MSSILDIDSSAIQTERVVRQDMEKEQIIRFLKAYYQFDGSEEIPVYPFEHWVYLDNAIGKVFRYIVLDSPSIVSLNNPTRFTSKPHEDVPELPISRIEERKGTNVYLQLVDDQWVIVPFDYNKPVILIDYYGDVLPDYIRFANGTSVCRIMTHTNDTTANYGYRVPFRQFGYPSPN